MKSYQGIVGIKEFLGKVGVKPFYFVFPTILSFGAAVFDGIAIGLLVPMARGVIGMDFSFVRDLPVFRTVFHAFPQIFINTPSPNLPIFILLLATIFTSTIAGSAFSYFSQLSTSFQARQFSRNMRQTIFSRYLSFGKLFFDRTNIGRLHTILFSFTDQTAYLLNHLRSLIHSIFSLIVYLAIMFMISRKLTILALLLFPTLYYSMNWLMEKIKSSSKIYADSVVNQSWRVFDILSCLPLVKSYSKEKGEKERFSKLSKSVLQSEFSIDKKMLLINPIQDAVVVIMLLIIISAMAFIFLKTNAGPISGFLVFFYIIRRCAPAFNSFNNFRAQLAKVEGPIKNLLQILDDKDKFFIPEGNKEFGGLKAKIDFRNLTFSYLKEIEVLKGISFSMEKGKMTAIVGPTGSGKTTLVNLILRFYDPPPSSIFFDGVDIRDFTLKSLRGRLALVSQETLLFNDTIKNNVLYGIERKISDEKLIETIKKARLYDFITALPDKFDTLIGDRGVKLSGGEKQRLSIARALLKGAEIIILDEATSSLDSKTERLIQEAMNEAIKDKTALVVAHRLSTIKNADRIIVIEDGRLVEEGPLQGLLEKKGRFYEYWQEQKFD